MKQLYIIIIWFAAFNIAAQEALELHLIYREYDE